MPWRASPSWRRWPRSPPTPGTISSRSARCWRTARPAAAAGHFAPALRLAPGDPAQALIETRALTGLTRLALAAGDFAAAKRHASAAARVAPDDAEVRLALQVLAGVPG